MPVDKRIIPADTSRPEGIIDAPAYDGYFSRPGGYTKSIMVALLLNLANVTAGGSLSVPAFGTNARTYPDIKIVGDPVVVYDYKSEHCDNVDIPDAPLRAFRRSDGLIVAFSTHYVNRRLIGSSLDNLNHDCQIVFQGSHSANPASFDDRTWIAATWTDDGRKVTVLDHNEYHAQEFAGQCLFSIPSRCSYNAIVPLVSTDGGSSFARADLPHAQPLAAAPFPSRTAQGESGGFSNPTNIIRNDDNNYYTIIEQSGVGAIAPGPCLFRTADVSAEDNSWSYYDGTNFVPSAGNPYDKERKRNACKPITGLSGAVGSITKIAGSKLFAAFMITSHKNIVEGGGIDVAFSEDLIHWSGSRIIYKATPYWERSCPLGVKFNYPSVLDNFSKARNFEFTGKSAYLFLVRMNCVDSHIRDLIWIPLVVTDITVPGRAEQRRAM